MIGSLNPLPFRVGGGPTPSSKAYQTIRQAVGQGGSARNDLGIDGLWRRSRAKGLAAVGSSTRRALYQAWPQLATDLLPYYERMTGLVPAPDATEAQRRTAMRARWTARPIRSWSELEDALQAIDPRFALVLPSDAVETVTYSGRAFDAFSAQHPIAKPLMGIAGGCSLYPAFSTRQRLRVSLALGYSPPTPRDKNRVLEARRLLRSALPSDQDFQISTGPWVLGSTPIGYGALA